MNKVAVLCRGKSLAGLVEAFPKKNFYVHTRSSFKSKFKNLEVTRYEE
jgi:hypothetical protein